MSPVRSRIGKANYSVAMAQQRQVYTWHWYIGTVLSFLPLSKSECHTSSGALRYLRYIWIVKSPPRRTRDLAWAFPSPLPPTNLDHTHSKPITQKQVHWGDNGLKMEKLQPTKILTNTSPGFELGSAFFCVSWAVQCSISMKYCFLDDLWNVIFHSNVCHVAMRIHRHYETKSNTRRFKGDIMFKGETTNTFASLMIVEEVRSLGHTCSLLLRHSQWQTIHEMDNTSCTHFMQ